MSRRARHRHDCERASGIGSLFASKSALIFDFDGTIADTTLLHARAFEETLAPLGVAVDYPSIAGLKTQDAIVRCLHTDGRREVDFDLPALVAEKQRRARTLIAEELKPIPDVEAFLVRARSRFRMAVVTSGSRGTVTLALRKLGYQDWFDPLVLRMSRGPSRRRTASSRRLSPCRRVPSKRWFSRTANLVLKRREWRG